MASSKFFVLCFLLFLLQTLPTLQFRVIPHDWNSYLHGLNIEYERSSFKTSEINSSKAVVSIKNITKALSNAGYEVMSVILENQLPSLVPYSDGKDGTVTIYNNNSITIFVPPNGAAVNLQWWNSLEYQAVMARVDKEGFESGSLPNGSELVTMDSEKKILVVTSQGCQNGFPSINGVGIKQWDVYNDGHLIVHGVENFFDFRSRGELQENFPVHSFDPDLVIWGRFLDD